MRKVVDSHDPLEALFRFFVGIADHASIVYYYIYSSIQTYYPHSELSDLIKISHVTVPEQKSFTCEILVYVKARNHLISQLRLLEHIFYGLPVSSVSDHCCTLSQQCENCLSSYAACSASDDR